MTDTADSRTFALGMAAAAWLVGLAVHQNNGYYSPGGLVLLSVAILIGVGVCVWPRVWVVEAVDRRVIGLLVWIGVFAEGTLLWKNAGSNGIVSGGVVVTSVLALTQALDLRAMRIPLACAAACVFCIAAATSFRESPPPNIDVLAFQQLGARGLLRGENPYTPGYPNVYEADTPFYGPGVVDATNHLTVGYPYPPLSLLFALPAYIVGGDSRFADVAAIAASAALMVLARPGVWTGLIGGLFLLMPRVFYVIEYAWTEALFAFSLSLLMCCAVRWRRGLPYALGAFLATKQYSAFALPFVPLLLGSRAAWKDLARVLTIAVALVAAITLPFFLWDPRAFWRSVVEFQFLQPLRTESLSHLVWIHKYLPWIPGQQGLPFVGLLATMAIAFWYRRPTPAYFAGAFGVAQLVFFAISKQAFANYYYFVFATLCWAAAASTSPLNEAQV